MTPTDFKILVVDDDADLLQINEKLLQKAGYLVKTAKDGTSCLNMVGEFHPDLILLDVVLPDENGVDICRRIKEDPSLSSTYIILFSGNKIDSDHISDGLETGADGYLVKPVAPREFLARIDAAARVVKAEKKLRLSEEKFAISFRATSQAVVISRASDGLIHDVNPSFSRITGYSRDEAIGKTTLGLNLWVNEEDRNMVVSLLTEAKKVSDLEFQFRKKDGDNIIGLFSCEFIRIMNETHVLSSITDITERKRLEDALRINEEDLAITLNSIGDGVISTNSEGMVERMNPMAEKLCGWTLNDAKGKPLSEVFRIVDANSRATIANPVDLVFKEGKVIELANHTLLVAGDGREYHISDSAAPIRNKEGRITGVVLVFSDATGKYLAQKALQESETRFKLLIENSPDAIALISPEGKFKYISSSAFRMFGFSAEEKDSLSPDNLTHPDDLPGVLANLGDIMQNPGKVITCQYRFRHKTQSWIWIESTFTNLLSEPAVEAIVINFHNINDRKRAETIQSIQYTVARASMNSVCLEELLLVTRDQLKHQVDTTNFFVALYKENTQTLRKVVWIDEKDDIEEWRAENSLSGFVVQKGVTLWLNREGIDKLASENGLTLFGTQPACWLGVPLVADGRMLGAMVVQHYDDPGAYDKTSVNLLEMIAHEISLFIARDLAGKELIAAKESAEQSDRLKSAFLANMSHEIRTPMNAIIGFSSMVGDEDLSPADRLKYAAIIKSRSDDLLHLINDILDISRIESGNAIVDSSEIHLNQLMEEVELVTRQKMERTRKTHLAFRCQKSLTSGSDIFHSDPYIIRQVLFNLLDNALKFTASGFVSFGYQQPEGPMITFFVKDTGIGVAPGNQSVIFNTFRQADIADHHKYGGTGLGLAICKGSIGLLGGKIWLESSAGTGSTFYFTLPFQPSGKPEQPQIEVRQAAASKNSIAPETGKFPGKKLIVVEDEPSNMEFLKIVLGMTGAEVVCAQNGRDLRNFYKDLDKIDLILLDIRLPDANGWELVKKIKEIRANIPVIAQTAFAMLGDKEKSMAAGCDDYISKPISKTALMQMLSRYLV